MAEEVSKFLPEKINEYLRYILNYYNIQVLSNILNPIIVQKEKEFIDFFFNTTPDEFAKILSYTHKEDLNLSPKLTEKLNSHYYDVILKIALDIYSKYQKLLQITQQFDLNDKYERHNFKDRIIELCPTAHIYILDDMFACFNKEIVAVNDLFDKINTIFTTQTSSTTSFFKKQKQKQNVYNCVFNVADYKLELPNEETIQSELIEIVKKDTIDFTNYMIIVCLFVLVMIEKHPETFQNFTKLKIDKIKTILLIIIQKQNQNDDELYDKLCNRIFTEFHKFIINYKKDMRNNPINIFFDDYKEIITICFKSESENEKGKILYRFVNDNNAANNAALLTHLKETPIDTEADLIKAVNSVPASASGGKRRKKRTRKHKKRSRWIRTRGRRRL
jgi:hypothetical protein